MNAQPWTKQEDPTTGRHLFCPTCQTFEQHAVTLTEDGNRKIKCQACGEVQAVLQPYGKLWIEKQFAERPSLIATFVLGRQEVARALMPKGEKEEEPKPKKEKRKAVKQKRTGKRLNLVKALAIPAIALGGLYFALTVLSLQYQVYLYPFTLVWDAVAFMGAETAVLAGILASSTAIALGILGIVLGKRGEKA